MALYDYYCSNCAQKSEISKKIADRDDIKTDPCPTCSAVGYLSRLISSPLIGYSTVVAGSYGTKIPEGFKDLLHKMHKNVAGSQLNHTSSFGDF